MEVLAVRLRAASNYSPNPPSAFSAGLSSSNQIDLLRRIGRTMAESLWWWHLN